MTAWWNSAPYKKKKKFWNCVSLHVTGSGGVRHTLRPLNLRACHLEIASKPEEPRVTKLPTSTKSLQVQKVTVTMSSGNWLSMRKPCNRDTKQFKFQRWTCSWVDRVLAQHEWGSGFALQHRINQRLQHRSVRPAHRSWRHEGQRFKVILA